MVPGFEEIRAFCEANADPAIVTKYSRFFTEGYDAWGVEKGVMEQQRSAWVGEVDGERDESAVLALCDQLVATGKFEEGAFAIDLAAAVGTAMSREGFDHTAGWFEDGGFRNWAHIDVACTLFHGPWVRHHALPLAELDGWRESPSRWKRRAYAVTLIQLLPTKGAGNPAPGHALPALLEAVVPMLDDPEKVVQQGVGWMLKDTWTADRDTAEAFFMDHAGEMASRVLTTAIEKIPKEGKVPFREQRNAQRRR